MIDNKQQFETETGLSWSAVSATLHAAAASAEPQTLKHFRSEMAVENKLAAAFDPVTEADRGAESAIRTIIANDFPEHAIIGEEHEAINEGSDFSWIIDPIDGTRAFISGVPLWGTLIGFAHRGRVLAGIMSQPFIGETYTGGPGGSFYRRADDQIRLATSGCTALGAARMFTTTPELFDTTERQAAWSALTDAALMTRYGCDCYAYCLLAAGHVDLVVEPKLNIYDIAALIPIIEQAGGVLATWDGRPADAGGDVVAAATPELLDEALRIIAGAQTD